MSRVYAIEEDSGDRVLVRLECDHPCCSARVLPHPEIALSGWTKVGGRTGDYTWESCYCPEHSEV